MRPICPPKCVIKPTETGEMYQAGRGGTTLQSIDALFVILSNDTVLKLIG